ncbi:MAG: hypothetical protein IPK52_12015 [Chloroflexi bacterium]|nr:hypothetical protein [Chloroflexota bacterium]
MSNAFTPRNPGGRRVRRPVAVIPCPECHAPAGANYLTCPGCFHSIESLWLADWAALLAAEGIASGAEDETLLAQVVAVDINAHPWTVVDVAHTRVSCPDCGAETGGGPLSCAACKFTFENLWAYDMEAGYQGAMTLNEHMIRVGRLELRYPHRFPPGTAEIARWLMPIGLTNPAPVEPHKMQAIYAAFTAGTLTPDQTRWENSFEAIYAKIAK